MEKKCSLTPHADVELGFERKPIEYFVTSPDNGINDDTGLILVIPGFGDRADGEYQKDKLRPYLANKYNCLAVGVNYFGAQLFALPGSETDYQLDVNAFQTAINDMFGVTPQEYTVNNSFDLSVLSGILAARGIRKLGTEFRLFYRNRNDINEYQSFGFLPAIDHLYVLRDVLKNYEVNRKKLIAFGTSYGGYISLLLGKFAPKTFSVLIDNSGFIKTMIENIDTIHVLRKLDCLKLNGVEYPLVNHNPWTIIDDSSPYYFSDSHRCIRNLLANEHIGITLSRYYIFHSIEDTIVPIKEKDTFCAMLRERGIEVNYRPVNSNDIDGKLFKNLNHGMDASLRGIFDLVASSDNLSKKELLTDFDEESIYRFNCGEKTYIFSYDRNYNIKVDLTDTE